VPPSYRDEDGYKLGAWAREQRAAHRTGRKGALGQERFARLEAVPGWYWIDDRWEQGLDALRLFVEREGHARVPHAYQDENGYNLGYWVLKQRMNHGEGRIGTLSQERIARLEAVPGWVWNALDARWEQAFAALQRFVEREGHACVPSSYQDENGYKLGDWVRHQREVRRQGSLGQERIARLETLPGWIWSRRSGGRDGSAAS
jgi:Helicase associated domain